MLERLYQLYDEMSQKGLRLFDWKLTEDKAATINMDGNYAVFIDTRKIHTIAEETCTVAHEYGHCITGATHAVSSPLDLIEKHEYKADKYASYRLIDPDELRQAVEEGYTEPWELAERFHVTEDFLRRAVYIYQCEGLID